MFPMQKQGLTANYSANILKEVFRHLNIGRDIFSITCFFYKGDFLFQIHTVWPTKYKYFCNTSRSHKYFIMFNIHKYKLKI